MRIIHVFKLPAVILAIVLHIWCTQDYNPFSDSTNARAIIYHSTITDLDTIDIFGDDVIKVSLFVRELIDSVRIESPENRFFSDTVFTITESSEWIDIPFRISYYDTGSKDIIVRTYKTGSDHTAKDELSLYVRSPLSQKKLTGSFGSEFDLKTNGVASKDVRYHWDFGGGVTIVSPTPETKAVITDAGLSDTGYLWVSDLGGNFRSPPTGFLFSLNDQTGPSILCINEGYTGRDTMPAGNGFALILRITDRGAESKALPVTADGKDFNLTQPPIYTAIINGMDTVDGFRSVSVEASDDADIPNVTQKIFWLYFDPSVKGSGMQLKVLAPPHDSTIFSTRNVNIFGSFQNYTEKVMDVDIHAAVDGTEQEQPFRILTDSSYSEWNIPVVLTAGTNTIYVFATDSSGDTISDTGLVLFYNSGSADNTPPEIYNVTVAGKSGYVIVPDEIATVRALAFDAGSGLRSMQIDGIPMQKIQESNSYTWIGSASLPHRHGEKWSSIIACDMKGLCDTFQIIAHQNQPPQLDIPPSPPAQIFVSILYEDHILIRDRDYDQFQITKNKGPELLDVDNYGRINWTPSNKDTGWHSIEIKFSDHLQSNTYEYRLLVKDTADESIPAFSNTEQDFGNYIEADVDTLDVALSVKSETGSEPYYFNASAPYGVTQPEFEDDSVFTWAPSIGDTGYQTVIVTVTDASGMSDTLVPVILVIGPNSPCSLSISHDLPPRQNGIIDLRSSTGPEILYFQIHDKDNPVAEKHTISVVSQAASTVSPVDSGNEFSIVIDPTWLTEGTHPLDVTVTDRRGDSFTLELELYVGP